MPGIQKRKKYIYYQESKEAGKNQLTKPTQRLERGQNQETRILTTIIKVIRRCLGQHVYKEGERIKIQNVQLKMKTNISNGKPTGWD